MFRSVNRPAFSAVQSGLFPIYFGMQTVLPIIMALTFPGNVLLSLPSGIQGFLDKSVRYSSLLPIAAMFVTGLTNLTVLLPMVTKVMKDRRGQGNIPPMNNLQERKSLMLDADTPQPSEMARNGTPRALTRKRCALLARSLGSCTASHP